MILIVFLLGILILQLYRIEQILQSVCRNQVTTAKLLGKAYGIGVQDKNA